MTSQKFLVLAVAALVALAGGLWLAARQAMPGAPLEALYPALEGELDAIETVRIFRAGDELAVELERGESGWTVTQRAGYPADPEKLRELVLAIAEAKRYEEKTSDPDQYAALEVGDTSRKDAKGLRIELTGPTAPVNLIVGKAGIGTSTHYVRVAGEPTSWLIDRRLDAPATPDAWLDREIVDIASERVQSATVTVAGEKSYAAVKESREDPDFDVENLPKGKSLRSPTVASGFSTALTGLILSDVRLATAFEPDAPADRATFRTFDGLVVALEGWKEGDKRFVALKASFDAAHAKRFEVMAEPGAAQPAAPDVEAEARTLAAQTARWVYEIPEYRYESLFKPIGELL